MIDKNENKAIKLDKLRSDLSKETTELGEKFMTKGIEEGDVCGHDNCTGIIKFQKSENCSCHINPPCSSCTTVNLYCPICEWEAP